MRLIIINLARATDRRAMMQAQCTALGLTADFLTATDGRCLTDAERALVDHAARRRITAYPLTDNEIGCTLSHRRAMRELLESGAAMAAIIEDDAILSADFPAVIAAIEAHAPAFDVIDLHRNFKKTETFLPCHHLPGGAVLGRIGPMNMNLTAYVISAAGAAKYLACPARFVHAIDKDLHSYWKNGLNIYGLQSPVAAQDQSIPSYIDETRQQNASAGRPTYPAAQAIHWRLIRRAMRLSDSIQKRLALRKLLRSP